MAVGALAAQALSWLVAASTTALPMVIAILAIAVAAVTGYAWLMRRG
jgi:hypothetical protein